MSEAADEISPLRTALRYDTDHGAHCGERAQLSTDLRLRYLVQSTKKLGLNVDRSP